MHFLLGQPFVVKTDHQSLKFLLDQKVRTPMLQKWLSKLMDYDFLVEYKKGLKNRAAYALSRKEEYITPTSFSVISVLTEDILEEILHTYADDSEVQAILLKFKQPEEDDSRFTIKEGVLY